MTYKKLPSVHTYGRTLMETLKDDTVSWLSGDCRYLITLLNGATVNRAFAPVLYDYVRLCSLQPDGEIELLLEKMKCPRDGTAAFVINELMDITTKHAGEFDIDMHIREFSRAMFDTTSLAIGAVADTKGRRGTTVWSSVTLMNFQKYKERQKDAV